jgi:glycogen debranching enzyme
MYMRADLTRTSSGFSPLNTPHLAPALELDNAIMDFSATLASKGLPTRVSSQSDVDVLLGALTTKVRDELKLWQYYVLDRAREKSGVFVVLSRDVPAWTGPDVKGKSLIELAYTLKSTGKILGLGEFRERYGVRVEPEDAASLLRAAFTELEDPNALADAWERIVDVINVPLYEEWEDDTQVALDSVKSRVDYTRLADHGPKLGEITTK